MELTGHIIEMTTRMVRTQTATTCLYIGVAAMILGALIAGFLIFAYKKRKWLTVSIFLAVFGLCMVLYGDSIPLQQQIYACADGPVSLEAISTTYDIQSIDGSFIIMVRR